MNKSREEFENNTATGSARKTIRHVTSTPLPSLEACSSVERYTRLSLEERVGDIKVKLSSAFESESFSVQEKREIGGVMQITENTMAEDPVENVQLQIQTFAEEARAYREKAKTEEDPERAQTFEDVSNLSEAESDVLRMSVGQAPKSEQALDIMQHEARQDPLTWRDKVMSIMRGLLVGDTVLGIIGGVVGEVFQALSYFHQGAKKAAHGVGEVAKSIKEVPKKAGPFFVPVLAATGAVVGVTATALSFVSDNITWLAPFFVLLFVIWLALRRRKKD